MSNSSFLSLAAPHRLRNNLGLEMSEGFTHRNPDRIESGYGYIEIPVQSILSLDGKPVEGEKAMRNQQIVIAPACTVSVSGRNRFEVHPNRAFWQYGVVQGMYYLEPGEGRFCPEFHIALRRDMSLEEALALPAIRIYMRS